MTSELSAQKGSLLMIVFSKHNIADTSGAGKAMASKVSTCLLPVTLMLPRFEDDILRGLPATLNSCKILCKY